LRGALFVLGLLIYLEDRGGSYNLQEFFGVLLMFLAFELDD
jgi:hypothetical protein